MAARSDAATDRVSLASAPSTATLTVGGWVKLASDRNDFSTFMRMYSAGGGTAITVGTKVDGTTPVVFSPLNSTGVAAAGMTVGTWTYIAYTLGAAGAVAIFSGTTPGSLSKATGTVAASGTADHLAIFGREPADATEWLDGSIAYWRIWTAVLSDAEIAAESQSATPIRTSGLWANWAFAAAALTDTVAGRNLTAGTTALTSDTDPALGGGSFTDAGTATIALGGSGVQSRTAPAAGTADAALAATGTSATIRTASGAATITLGSSGTVQAQRAAAGTADVQLATSGTAARATADAGTAALLLGATGTFTRQATDAGAAALVLGSDGAYLHVAAAAGTADLALLATGTVDSGSDQQAGTAVLTLDAVGVHTAIRAAAGSAVLALEAVAAATTVRTAVGQAVLVLVATGVVTGEQRDLTITARLLPARHSARVLPGRWHVTEV